MNVGLTCEAPIHFVICLKFGTEAASDRVLLINHFDRKRSARIVAAATPDAAGEVDEFWPFHEGSTGEVRQTHAATIHHKLLQIVLHHLR